MNESALSLDIFRSGKEDNGRYNPSQRMFAVMLLDCDKKERKGIETPQYKHYSDMLGIPLTTLKHWYADKEHIFKESSAIAQGVIQTTQMQIALSLPSIYNKLLESLDSGNMKDSDKINLFREAVNKMRLLGNQSTSNVEHRGEVQFSPVVPTKLSKYIEE